MLLIAACLTCAAAVPAARARAPEPATLEDACHAQWCAGPLPLFRLFHHRFDGIHDLSCGEKARAQLLAHGYPEAAPYLPDGDRQRRLRHHFRQDEYSPLVLEFFATRIGR